MILRYKVKVIRNVASYTTSTGAPIMEPTPIYTSLKCDLQPDKGVVVQPIQGQTTVYYKNMFCYPADIKPNDIVIDLESNEKMKVININPYTLLKHMEVRLQGGVL